MSGVLAALMRLPKAALGGMGVAVMGGGVFAASLLGGGSSSAATLQVLEGRVTVSVDGGAFRTARNGEVLKPVTTVKTAEDGRAALKYFDGSVSRLDFNTTFQLKELSGKATGDKIIRAYQSSGRTFNRVVKLTGSTSRVEVQTPNATASVRGTEFIVEDEIVKVFEGVIVYRFEDGREVRIEAGFKFDPATGEVVPLTPEDYDDWWKYNNCDNAAGNTNITQCQQNNEDEVVLAQDAAPPPPVTGGPTRITATQPSFVAPPAAVVQQPVVVEESTEESTPDPTPDPTPVPTAAPVTVGSVTGTVTDASTNQALNGAVVQLVGSSQTATVAGGVFGFADLPAGSHTFRAMHDGYNASQKSADVEPGETETVDFALTKVEVVETPTPSPTASPTEEPTPTPSEAPTASPTPVPEPETGTIDGTVLDSAGQPIPGAQIALDSNAPVDVDLDGSFAFDGLVLDSLHSLTASAPGYDAQPIGGIPVPSTVPIVLGLTTGSITGSVYDEAGAPIDGATIALGSDAPIPVKADGSFSFTDLVARDTYSLTAAAPNYAPQTRDEVSVGSHQIFNLVVDRGTINGSVLDGANQPIDGAQISLDGADPVAVQPNGSFEFTNVPANELHMLTASAPGYDTQNVGGIPVGSTVPFNLALTRGSITGSVLDEGGNTIEGAKIALDDAEPIAVNADGSFSFTELIERDTYKLTASAPDYDTQVRNEVAVGSDEDFRLTATPGRIFGVVRDSRTGDPINDAYVSLDGADPIATSNGSYEFGGLAPGEYAIRATASGYGSNNIGVTVEPAGNHEFDILLTHELKIVLNWNAEPLDLNAHLWLPSTDKYHVSTTQRGSQTECPFVELDVDDTDGFGPETITIAKPYSGMRYAVHKKSNEPIRLSNAGAVVRVIEGNETLATYDVPSDGTTEKWWHVFDITRDASTGAWVITPTNTLSHPSPAPYDDETGACSPAA
ncbi:MAG TPA: carboxypeptidase regulatory-like domain-containing protein [Actinomycetota bacterium]|nr:carboxypeptidase regulatory-like domain-containing protein [Actinomycetota bacterium]